MTATYRRARKKFEPKYNEGTTMNAKRMFFAAAVSAGALIGTGVKADLFDRLRGRSEAEVDRKDSDKPTASFAVADARDIGKIVSPVSYQPLPAPGAEPALVPVPEPYPFSTAPAPVRSYYPAEPYAVPGMPITGYPMEGAILGGPAYPIGPGMGGDGFPLFERVKYEDLNHIHPCAVPTVVQVMDPCSDNGRRGLFGHRRAADCDACPPQCVYVQICVPPGCPRIKVEKHGRKVKYDYGDYKVEVESKDGYVEVDYDD